jgi:sugar phosphate permease
MDGALGTGSGGGIMPFLLTGSTMVFGLTALQTGFLYSAIPGLLMMFIVPFVIRNRPEDDRLGSTPKGHSTFYEADIRGLTTHRIDDR